VAVVLAFLKVEVIFSTSPFLIEDHIKKEYYFWSSIELIMSF
jgi:hypothetical protein